MSAYKENLLETIRSFPGLMVFQTDLQSNAPVNPPEERDALLSNTV